MKKYAFPLAAAGLGTLTLLVFSERGRRGLRWLLANAEDLPERALDWNDAVQHELSRIQETVNRLAQTLESVR